MLSDTVRVLPGPEKDPAIDQERRLHNVKRRLVLILASLAALVAAGILVVPSFLAIRQVALEKDKGVAEGKAITVRTKVDGFGVHKGDAFPYSVEVQYNVELVSGLDKTSLDKSVNFKPFEVRRVAEREFDLNPRTRVFAKEYEIQLIDGKVNTLYKVPSILIRYKSKESGAYEEKALTPEPVFIASRLPPNANGLDLKPIQGSIKEPGRDHIRWVLTALGVFLALLALVDLAWRTIPQWREAARQRRKAEGVDVLSEAYRSLNSAMAQGAEPGRLLHRMNHILRIVLARKENVGWLEEPDPDRIPSGIKAEALSFLKGCQSTDWNPSFDQKQVQEAQGHLEKILGFYFGEGQVRAWKR
jgi:hypothetical protein